MTKRNDPCPCGSGKKYKHCCMPRDQVISLARVRYDRAYQTLLGELADYCTEYEGEDVERAQAQFFGAAVNDVRQDEELADTLSYAFLDWFAFSYSDWETGSTMAAAFREGRRESTEVELLTAWEKSRPGFHIVERVENGLVVLKDAFTGEACQADLDGDEKPAPGTLILGRLLPTGEIFRPGFDLVEGPADVADAVRPLLERELARMRRAFPEAGWDDLFRERWPLVRDLISVAMLSRDQGLPITLPEVSDAEGSRGIVAPPGDAPESWVAVYEQVLSYSSENGMPFSDAEAALRLWWDAAAALGPRVVRPEVWAASVIYTWHHWVHRDELTQVQLAEAFGVSPSTVGSRSREIARALNLQVLDDRYADMLDPSVRSYLVLSYLAAAAAE